MKIVALLLVVLVASIGISEAVGRAVPECTNTVPVPIMNTINTNFLFMFHLPPHLLLETVVIFVGFITDTLLDICFFFVTM